MYRWDPVVHLQLLHKYSTTDFYVIISNCMCLQAYSSSQSVGLTEEPKEQIRTFVQVWDTSIYLYIPSKNIVLLKN